MDTLPRSKKLVIIMPAYNEASTVGEAVALLPRTVPGIAEVLTIVINDGSTDSTADIARGEGAEVLSHDHNYGVGRAIRSGIEVALERGADIVVSMDADRQFDPFDIPALIEPILNGEADFVTGSRFIDPLKTPTNMPPAKRWGNRRVAKMVSLLSGKNFYDVSCGFRAYNREALLHLNLQGQFTYTQEMFLDLAGKGLRIKEVPVHVRYFEGRTSKVANNLMSYGWKIFWLIFKTFRDYEPLKFFGTIGAGIFIIGLIFDLILFIHFLLTGAFTPYKSAGFVGGFLNIVGLGVFVLGLVADMLVRIRRNQELLLYYERKRRFEHN